MKDDKKRERIDKKVFCLFGKLKTRPRAINEIFGLLSVIEVNKVKFDENYFGVGEKSFDVRGVLLFTFEILWKCF